MGSHAMPGRPTPLISFLGGVSAPRAKPPLQILPPLRADNALGRTLDNSCSEDFLSMKYSDADGVPGLRGAAGFVFSVSQHPACARFRLSVASGEYGRPARRHCAGPWPSRYDTIFRWFGISICRNRAVWAGRALPKPTSRCLSTNDGFSS
jgi:hypothetical protein